MAKKNSSMQDKVISGLYLTSVAFTFTILSRLAGNIMYGGSENETIKDHEIKKLQEIVAKVNEVDKNADEIDTYISKLFTHERKNDDNVITFSELGKYIILILYMIYYQKNHIMKLVVDHKMH